MINVIICSRYHVYLLAFDHGLPNGTNERTKCLLFSSIYLTILNVVSQQGCVLHFGSPKHTVGNFCALVDYSEIESKLFDKLHFRVLSSNFSLIHRTIRRSYLQRDLEYVVCARGYLFHWVVGWKRQSGARPDCWQTVRWQIVRQIWRTKHFKN